MISARSMWSYLLLGVYSLILLHDFIPHSHQDVHTGKKVYAAIQYIQHAFCDNSFDRLLQPENASDVEDSASSSAEEGHLHELSYRVEHATKKSFQANCMALGLGTCFLTIDKAPAPKGIYHTGFTPEENARTLGAYLRGPPPQA